MLLTPEKVRRGRGGAGKRRHHPLPDGHSPGAERAMGWPRKPKKPARVEVKDGCGKSLDEEEATVFADMYSVAPYVVFTNKSVGKSHLPLPCKSVGGVVIWKNVVVKKWGGFQEGDVAGRDEMVEVVENFFLKLLSVERSFLWSESRWSCVIGHYVDDDVVVFVKCGFFYFVVGLVEFVCGVFDDFVVCCFPLSVVVVV